MLTRRTFLKALAAGAAGLALPASAAEALAAPAHRLWALDGTMLGTDTPRLVALDGDGWYTFSAPLPLWVEIGGRRFPYPAELRWRQQAAFPAEYTVYRDGTVSRSTLAPTTLRVDAPPGAYPIVRVD